MSAPILPRAGSKQALIANMLGAEDGASIRDLVDATGWQPNTVHAALATLRKGGRDIKVTPADNGNRYRFEIESKAT